MSALVIPSTVSAEKAAFIKEFYAVSDQPEAIEKYLSFLSDDVDFIMGLNATKGKEAVRKLRDNMWGGVVSRKHTPERIYVHDAEGSELMLYGTVDYGLRNGKKVDAVGWAGRMVFNPSAEGLELSRYQVWLDAAPLAAALKEL